MTERITVRREFKHGEQEEVIEVSLDSDREDLDELTPRGVKLVAAFDPTPPQLELTFTAAQNMVAHHLRESDELFAERVRIAGDILKERLPQQLPKQSQDFIATILVKTLLVEVAS